MPHLNKFPPPLNGVLPLTSLIAKAYDALYASYVRSGMNIVNAPCLISIGLIIIGPCKDFLTNGINANNPKSLADIRLSDHLKENSLSCKSRNALKVICNLFLNMPQDNVLKKRLHLSTRAIHISIFFGSIQKGSKKYSIIMEH